MIDTERQDRDVRGSIARSIRERGILPTIAMVADDLKTTTDEVRASFDRMIAAHVFIPRRGSSEIYAYDPFCVGPTEYRVRVAERDHFAICGWDALGIPSALGMPGTIRTACPDCREPIVIDVDGRGGATSSTPTVLNVGVPARSFWDDIYFT